MSRYTALHWRREGTAKTIRTLVECYGAERGLRIWRGDDTEAEADFQKWETLGEKHGPRKQDE